MKRHWIWLLLAATLLIVSACRPATEIDQMGSPEPAASETDTLEICQPQDEDCGETPAAPPTADPVASPTVQPQSQPTVTPTPASAETAPSDDPFAVRETDWVMGADDPVITMIEYGDFQ